MISATSRLSLQKQNAEVVMIAGVPRVMLAALVWGMASSALAAEGGAWSVSKSTGEVWITTTGAEPVSLEQKEIIEPGDTIRTGRNGRVLLVRGEETILVAPNTVIGLSAETKEGLSTTILQRAGSVLLDVEKRNVKHFEVETPYLAAVVKGTQFAVTVNAGSTSVEVRRGQVEVSDFKSGQIAQVVPGQTATAFANGKPGLSLSGAGPFNPIEQGRPRASSIERTLVPKSGLSAPHNAGDGKLIHALGPAGTNHAKSAAQSFERQRAAGNLPAKRNVVHLSAALGEIRLNVHKATHGLAHGFETAGSMKRASTVWSDSQASVNTTATSNQGSNTGTNAVSTASPAAPSGSVSTTTANAVSANASGNGDGNGNGATGNGKSNGNANNGNGNGNHGVGNGNGKGNAKH
jgi:FecR protein